MIIKSVLTIKWTHFRDGHQTKLCSVGYRWDLVINFCIKFIKCFPNSFSRFFLLFDFRFLLFLDLKISSSSVSDEEDASELELEYRADLFLFFCTFSCTSSQVLPTASSPLQLSILAKTKVDRIITWYPLSYPHDKQTVRHMPTSMYLFSMPPSHVESSTYRLSLPAWPRLSLGKCTRKEH